MKISKEQQMGFEMKTSHDRISNFSAKVTAETTISDRLNIHRRKMDHVHRLSGFKLFQEYSLTHHCFHTGLLFMEIALKENIPLLPDYIDFVFKHDILETVTGDMLYPAKNYNQHTKTAMIVMEGELTRQGEEFEYLKMYTDDYAEAHMHPRIVTLFKACDLLELWEFCNSEVNLGNMSVMPIVANCQELLEHCGIKTIEDRVTAEWI